MDLGGTALQTRTRQKLQRARKTHTRAHTHTTCKRQLFHTHLRTHAPTGPGQIEVKQGQERGRLLPGGVFNDEAITQGGRGAGLKASLVASAPNTVIVAFTAADVERVAVRSCVHVYAWVCKTCISCMHAQQLFWGP